jgi:hypothetical protein
MMVAIFVALGMAPGRIARNRGYPWAQAVAIGGTDHGMCDKCQELEKKIERYRKIAFSINDQLTIDRFNQLIKDTEAEKAKLHPNQQQ